MGTSHTWKSASREESPSGLEAVPESLASQHDGVEEQSDNTDSQIMNVLFARMAKNYAHLWDSRFSSVEQIRSTKIVWGKALEEYSNAQINQGIDRCFEHFPLPPTMDEFVHCCEPRLEDFGLPSPEQAYREACLYSHVPMTGHWSHPAVFHASKKLPSGELSHGGFEVQDRFTKAYHEVCLQVMKGETFKLPKRESQKLEFHAITQEQRSEHEKQTAFSALDELKHQLGMDKELVEGESIVENKSDSKS